MRTTDISTLDSELVWLTKASCEASLPHSFTERHGRQFGACPLAYHEDWVSVSIVHRGGCTQ